MSVEANLAINRIKTNRRIQAMAMSNKSTNPIELTRAERC